jgi:hypothetical protein
MKKNIWKLIGIIALAAVIGLGLAGCADPTGGGGDDNGGDPVLSGTIYITTLQGENSAPYTRAILGQTLYVRSYSPDDDFPEHILGSTTFQWNKDGTAISGATGTEYTPTEAGSYTVTASRSDYEGNYQGSKTSDPFPVIAAITPQDFAGTYGDRTIPTEGDEGGGRLVISDVTDTGATLVYTVRRDIDPGKGTNYQTYSVTCDITWGNALEKLISNSSGQIYGGFEITGTSQLTTGEWSYVSDHNTIFGATDGPMPAGVKICIQIRPAGYYVLALLDNSGYYDEYGFHEGEGISTGGYKFFD